MLKYFRLALLTRILKAIKRWSLAFLGGLVFAILCFVTLNAAMKPFSTSEYCGTNCHEMDTAYQSWKLSVHGANEKGLRVDCVDCHLPSKDKYFTHLMAKAYAGGKNLYKQYFGDEYNTEKVQEEVLADMSNKTCLSCHVDLLAKPSSDEVREAHMESLNSPEVPENRCVECHEDVGHERY
ncbi:MAG: cytochrome c3 family protein [Planctomycetota bacterium]|jgi:cytochrome c-type protein NapC/trimethylamine-N-oxide reductase cytochrome c-type subunit TorC